MTTFTPDFFTPDQIEAATLNELLQGKEPFVLIDVLPPEHFARVHIPAAKNACVYEVTFQQQIEAITTDKHAPIILYGAGENSLDAIAAAGKLSRWGYTDISVYAEGIEGWDEAGYPLEGTDPAPMEPEQPFVPDIERDRSWHILTNESTLQWFGRNPNGMHHGTIPVSGGFTLQQGQFGGSVTIHMKELVDIDLAGDELHPVLEEHLHSDDFFFTSLFPQAKFTITSAVTEEALSPTIPNLHLTGTLEIRGVKKYIDFPATVSALPDGKLAVEAHLDIDRTRWGIIYGSTRFFEHLSYHLVFDDITVFARFVAE